MRSRSWLTWTPEHLAQQLIHLRSDAGRSSLAGARDVQGADGMSRQPAADLCVGIGCRRVADEEGPSVPRCAARRPIAARVRHERGGSQHQCGVGVADVPFRPLRARHVRSIGAAFLRCLAQREPRGEELAAAKGLSPAQLAIAWVLAKGDTIVPVIGARTRTQLAESLRALEVRLSPEELARVEEALPASAVAGTRYDAHQMGMLDSER